MTDVVAAPRMEPPETETSAPFWAATREQRLVVQWCTACESPVWFPREVCPACLGSGLEWRASEGTGSVYTFAVEHRPPSLAPLGDHPYVVALVELDEGIRMMTNIVGCEPAQVRVGQRVEVAWERLSDGRHLPLFTPVPA
jgi:uncharacterized OB-fold protein